MITLINGKPQTPAGLIVPNGSVGFQLNCDATVVAAPFGFVSGDIEVVFQFDANGLIQPNAPATAAQIYSNKELNPQNSVGLATYYLVVFYDANGARINQNPMWWQFPEAAGATVDIGQMTPIATVGGNVIFYPTSFGGGGTVTSVAFVGDGTILSATPSTPVTTSGNIAATLLTQSANTVLAGPTSGPAIAPTFRLLASADIPVPLTLNAAAAANALTLANPTAATNLANQSSPTFVITGNVWNGSASVADSWTIQNSIGVGTLPGQSLMFRCSQGNGLIDFSTSTVLTGQLNSGAIFTGGPVSLTSAAATGIANVSSYAFNLDSSWWDGAAAHSSITSIQDLEGAGANPTDTTQISNSGAFAWAGVNILGKLQFVNATDGKAAFVQSKTFSLTAAQIKALVGTPITLIASPGANKTIVPICVLWHYRFVTTPFTVTGGSNLFITYTGGSTSNYLSSAGQTGFLDQGHDEYVQTTFGNIANLTTAIQVNTALVMIADFNPTVGDGTLTVSIQYTIADVTVT